MWLRALAISFIYAVSMAGAQTNCTVRDVPLLAPKHFVMCDGMRTEVTEQECRGQAQPEMAVATLCPERTSLISLVCGATQYGGTHDGEPEPCDLFQSPNDSRDYYIRTDRGDIKIRTGRDSTLSRDGQGRPTITNPPRGVTLVDGALTVDQTRVERE